LKKAFSENQKGGGDVGETGEGRGRGKTEKAIAT